MLIGREAEIDATATLVRDHRVATVVGPGGVGKTRLATEVGRRLLSDFEDGVFMADFAPVADAAGVTNAIAVASGVELEFGDGASTNLRERLREFLRGRHALLILDNCEHVIALAAEMVENLVSHCGGLRVLTTSREPLMITGEVLWPLAPLELHDAVALFVQRAPCDCAVVRSDRRGRHCPRTLRTA